MHSLPVSKRCVVSRFFDSCLNTLIHWTFSILCSFRWSVHIFGICSLCWSLSIFGTQLAHNIWYPRFLWQYFGTSKNRNKTPHISPIDDQIAFFGPIQKIFLRCGYWVSHSAPRHELWSEEPIFKYKWTVLIIAIYLINCWYKANVPLRMYRTQMWGCSKVSNVKNIPKQNIRQCNNFPLVCPEQWPII